MPKCCSIAKKRVIIWMLSFCYLMVHFIFASDYFVGRDNVLLNIDENFKKDNIVVVQGLAGMGKSISAKLYFDAKKDVFSRMFWIDWDPLSFKEQMSKVARDLKKEPLLDKNDFLEAIIKRVSSLRGDVLFVIDGCDDVGDVDFVLTKLQGIKKIKILVTSRENTAGFPCVKLGPFLENESVHVLKKIAPLISDESALTISNALGNYPFFVVKIAKSIADSATTNEKRVTDVLSKRGEIEILDFISQKSLKNKGSTKVEKKQRDVGEIAMLKKVDNLKKTDPEAYKVLVFLSFLNSKYIPMNLLYVCFKDEDLVDRIVNSLISSTFISDTFKDKDMITFEIHQIMQQIVRSQVTEDEKNEALNRAISGFCEFYAQYFDSMIDPDWEDKVFYTHIFTLKKHVENFNEKDSLLLDILLLKRYLYSHRNPSEADSIFEKTEVQLKKTPLNADGFFADYLCDAVFMKGFSAGEDSQCFLSALNDAEKALEIYEKDNNIDGWCRIYVRIAWIYLYQGNLEKSLENFLIAKEHISKVTEKSVLKEYYFVGSWYYYEAGDFQESINFCRKGIEINDISKNLYLGVFFRVHMSQAQVALGLIDDSLLTVAKGLEIESELLNSEGSLARAEFLSTKALCLLGKGETLEARDCAKESVELSLRLLKNEPYQPTATALFIWGEIELKLGDQEKALDLFEQSEKMFSKVTHSGGVDSFAQCLKSMCHLLLSLGKKEAFTDVYKSFEKRFGSDNKTFKKLQFDLVKEGYRSLV